MHAMHNILTDSAHALPPGFVIPLQGRISILTGLLPRFNLDLTAQDSLHDIHSQSWVTVRLVGMLGPPPEPPRKHFCSRPIVLQA